MNRRDTIIIAVLLNASLLAILFVMAVNNDDVFDPHDAAHAIVDVTEHTMSAPQEILAVASTNAQLTSTQTGDEIDNALKQYADNPQLILVDDEADHTVKESPEVPPAVTTTPPQNPAPQPSTHTPQIVEITVKKGDALEKIARANNTTVEAIKKASHLTSNKLNIGQILKVPVGMKKSSPEKAEDKEVTQKETKNISEAEELYTIKSGDNPWKIAKQFHVKFDELLKMNNLDEDKARNLKVGDKIRVK